MPEQSSVVLPYPHPGQQIVRREARRWNFLSAGRRWRKTTLFMSIMVEAALAGKRVISGAPTYDQTRIGWEEAQHAAAGVGTFTLTDKVFKFPGGGRITYRSLDDPDNARGHTADLVVIDEAGDVAEAAWYEVCRPMLMDTGGEAWIGGTPKGRNWFWREYMAAQDQSDAATWNAPTLGCIITRQGLVRRPHQLENPHVPWAELEQMFRTLPERVFRQEILAEFIEDAGGVFRGVHECVDPNRSQPEPPRESFAYSMGVDLARVNDFTVLSVLDDFGRQVYFERFNEISWSRQIASIERVARQYEPVVVVDATGVGDPIVEQLEQLGLGVRPVTLTNTNKMHLVDKLATDIESGRISLMNIEVQTAELQAYQYELTESRNIRTNAPEGMHDDTVIALALANSLCAYVHREQERVRDEDDEEFDDTPKGFAGAYY